ncbi:MAG: alpha/beta hydrolase [Spirochaetales bacterium]|nr:alpha/beta hydrolase [Spirochaetales bacterium]
MKLNCSEKSSFFTTYGKKNSIRIFEVSKKAPNVIFIMTPIGSVHEELAGRFMNGLVGKTCNVFALDFLGIGRSEGKAKDISVENIFASTLKLIEFIKENYNDNIHFYGGTGTGGVIGQALVSSKEIGKHIKSFIQYGVAIYKDVSIFGNDRMIKTLYPILKLLNKLSPGSRIKFKIPPYDGVNAEKEKNWYLDVMKEDPKAFDFKISLFKTLLDLMFSKKSSLKDNINCPVLILAPKHDRYYYPEYVSRYFNMLNKPKELYSFDGSHLSFDWKAEELNSKVIQWVDSFSV